MHKSKRKNDEPRPRSVSNIIFTTIGHFLTGTRSFIGNIITGAMRGTWWLMRMIGHGSWWLTKLVGQGTVWSIRRMWRGLIWSVTLPWFFLRYIINGRIPNFENARQEEIFWRIKRQYRRKRLLMLHGMAYSLGLLFTVGVTIHEVVMRLSDRRITSRSIILEIGAMMAVWGVILFFHFLFTRMSNEEDEALGEALEREYERSDYQQSYDEPHERLIEPLDYESYDYEEKSKRNHHMN